jgi:hypothetical protein
MVVPVWFGHDDDGTIVFTTYEKTAKAQAISRDPRVSRSRACPLVGPLASAPAI